MSSIGLIGLLVILGQVALGISTGGLALWVQRKFFLKPDEYQSFVIPGTVAIFASAYYFWLVIQIDFP
jgi:hypothetical protein